MPRTGPPTGLLIRRRATTIRLGTEGTQTQTFIAGIFGSTVSDVSNNQAVYVDETGNLGSIAISSLTTGATGATGGTGATGLDGLNGTGVDNDGSGDTAAGSGSLQSLSGSDFGDNTAFGQGSLNANADGANNTGTGYSALFSNQYGNGNTADGYNALGQATGSYNVGLGYSAGSSVMTGSSNIEILNGGNSADGTTDGVLDPTTGPAIRLGTQGVQTQTFIAGIFGATTSDPTMNQAVVIDDSGNLGSVDVSTLVGPTGPQGPSGAPTDSFLDTAGGTGALASLNVSSGSYNTAFGANSLGQDVTGTENTASGYGALNGDTAGTDNTAVGYTALYNATGGHNIGLGSGAGYNVAAGNNNIEIFDEGAATDGTTDGTVDPTTGPTIRIGTEGTQKQTFIAGVFGATPVDSGLQQAVVVDDLGNMGSIPISSLTTGATGDTGPTGATGQNGLNGTGVDTDGSGDTGAGSLSLASLGGLTNAQNSAFGQASLFSNTDAYQNTGTGASALYDNQNGIGNTADGYDALGSALGSYNTALGTGAGSLVRAGSFNNDIFNGGNSADGTTDGSADPTTGPTIRLGTVGIHTQTFIAGIYGAATSNPTSNQAVVIDSFGNMGSVDVSTLVGPTGDTGPTGPSGAPTDSFFDTAGGEGALASLTVSSDSYNTAFGALSLGQDSNGTENTASGYAALNADIAGTDNTAVGYTALYNATGGHNIGVGSGAGYNVAAGNNNIEIFDEGAATDGTTDGTVDPTTGPTIRIGTEGTQKQTFIAGVFGATPVDSGLQQAVVVDDLGNMGSIPISSLTTGATGDTGPTGATGQNGLNGTGGVDTDISGDTGGGDLSLASLGGVTNSQNTAFGEASLFALTDGSNNTATGYALAPRQPGWRENTAVGAGALDYVTTGNYNVGLGVGAGAQVTNGGYNIDILNSGQPTDGTSDGTVDPTTGPTIRIGSEGTQTQTFIAGVFGSTPVNFSLEQAVVVDDYGQLGSIQLSSLNGATGDTGPTGPAGLNGSGVGNDGAGDAAAGDGSLQSLSGPGTDNTADGVDALYQATGSFNIGLGSAAGFNVTTGSNNIEIFDGGNSFDGTTDGSADPTTGPTIRIGAEGTQTQTFIAGIYGATTSNPTMNQAVVIDNFGNLGSEDVGILTGPTGPVGVTGPTGDTGPTGSDGLNATPSDSSGTSTASGSECPCGPKCLHRERHGLWRQRACR